MESPEPPGIAPGGDDLAHWDPRNPRDLATISRRYERSPKAFRDMTPEKQARVVRIVNNAMLEAERMQQSPIDAERIAAVELAEKLAKVSGQLVAIQLRDEHHAADHNQRERHHADDVARGAGGTTVNVGVQVNTMTDADRIRIATEAGVLHLLPAELAEKAKEAQ